jgi:hypothetical protein
MKASIFAIGLVALATTAASAEPAVDGAVRLDPISVSGGTGVVTRNTITGYAASAAVAEGASLNPVARSVSVGRVTASPTLRVRQVRDIPFERDRMPVKSDGQSTWDADNNNG